MTDQQIEYLAKCQRGGTRADIQMIENRALDLLAEVIRLRDENRRLRKESKWPQQL